MSEVRLMVTTVTGQKYRSAWEEDDIEQVKSVIRETLPSDSAYFAFNLESGEQIFFNATHIVSVMVAER